MNFISIKEMKWKLGKSYNLFYFQVRESPAPLNIPTLTPAPDRGGPVACLGGPVAVHEQWSTQWSTYHTHERALSQLLLGNLALISWHIHSSEMWTLRWTSPDFLK